MNHIDLAGRVAVVTGGARGIGLAIARRLVESGARCSLWDVDDAALAEASRDLGPPAAVHTVAVDITKPEAVGQACQATILTHGHIDILINNAGIAGVSKKLWECSIEEWRRVLELDLFAVFLCCHVVVPEMLKRGCGRIVNIASIAGKEGNPNASHYSAL